MSDALESTLTAFSIVLALVLAWYVGWVCGRQDEREKWALEIDRLRRENELLRKAPAGTYQGHLGGKVSDWFKDDDLEC